MRQKSHTGIAFLINIKLLQEKKLIKEGQKMEEEYIKNYLADLPCGYCGQQYVSSNMELVNNSGSYYTFSVYCQYCNRQNFVTVFVNKGEVIEPEVELNEEEIVKFCTPLCSDDVLDMHTFLKDFDGDFSALFPEIMPSNNSTGEPQTEELFSCNNDPEQSEGEKS